MLLLLFIAAPLHAQVFQWLDGDGNPQFGDRPPPGARDVRPLDIDTERRISPNSDAATRLQRQQQVAEELERARVERERQRAAAIRRAREAASLCGQYRDRVRLLADEGVN